MTTRNPPLSVEQLHLPVDDRDRDAVLALEAASFSNPWTAETFDAMLARPVSQVYVARVPDAGIVGFCACWVIEDEIHINTIAVDTAWRRRGVGSGLLKAILERTGPRRATLEVRRSNTAALGLYEKLGFEVTAVRAGYYSNPEEDGMILWLNP
ncbi:MAG TPA: ribosomal protein S18-alanine N-acetyltransferase [Vicinamibacterales bacterium]|nr:ribosomal protein S18-alanine N-acetyltransferase [Vicinamibacterales bacterium]